MTPEPRSAIGSRILARPTPDGWSVHAVEYEVPLERSVVVDRLVGENLSLAIDEDGFSVAADGPLRFRPGATALDGAAGGGDSRLREVSGPLRFGLDGRWHPIPADEHARAAAAEAAAWRDWMARRPAVAPAFADVVERCWRTLGENTLRLRSRPDVLAIVPSLAGYVGAWQWDSYFIAVGLRHGDPALARDQLRLVTDPQSPDGQLPDVVHDGGVLAGSEDLPEADRASLAHAGSPYLGQRVPLTKPPLLAWAADLVNRVAPHEAFTARMFERARANHAWWFADSSVAGVPYYRHPYSSGLDDSPVFDAPCGPTPDLLAYLAAGERVLAAHRPSWANAARQALLVGALRERADGDTIVALLGLFGGFLDAPRVAALAAAIDDPARFGGRWRLPTVSRASAAYAPRRLWRGPVWVNTNVLVAEGLRASGRPELAKRLERETLALVDRFGPWEYFDSADGGPGEGAVSSFSWSAALAVDLAVRLSR